MKCIDDELIQKYIDGEAHSEEVLRIEKHVASCPQCARKIEEARAFSDGIKRKIGHWGRQPVVIPEFVMPVTGKRKLNVKIKHYIYAVSAACAIFLIVSLFPGQKSEKEIRLMYNFDGDFDANRPVSEQEMSIIMIDADGRIVECN